MRQRYQAVLFDLDDTLVTLSEALPVAWGTARQLCVDVTGVCADKYEEVSIGVRERLFEKLDAGLLKLAEVRSLMFKETLEQLGIHDDQLVEQLHTCFGETQLARIGVFPDTHILQHIKRVARIGIVTNGACDDHPESQLSKIKLFGFDRLAEFSLISDECGHRKPKREIFAMAVDRLQVPPETVLFVGDSLVNDVAGANGAGLVSVWLNRAGECPEQYPQGGKPSFTITALDQLLPLLAGSHQDRR